MECSQKGNIAGGNKTGIKCWRLKSEGVIGKCVSRPSLM